MTKSEPVDLLGEAPPRVLVKPRGARANSWQDVSDLSASLGVPLDDWQDLILEAAMGERADRTWAAKRVGISVPRQNGKSQLLVARALAGALLFGEKKIVISAHQQDTAREAFGKLVEIIEDDDNEWLRSQLDTRFGRGGIMNALNREAVKFSNGAQVQFKARSGSAGKGFSSDCLLLDEAQILGSRAWTSINSTMSAMRNPQVWLLGTPPQEEDDCFAFDMVRKSAVDGTSTSAAWCEWSADPYSDSFDPASEYTRWSANPAWNIRINHEVVQGEYETYTPDRFKQDRLGIWRTEAGSHRLISTSQWDATVAEAPADGVRSFAVTFSQDGSRQAVAGGVKHEGRSVHVNLVGSYSGSTEAGVSALADWLAERHKRTAMIALCGRAGSTVLSEALIARGVPKRMVHVMSTTEYFTANAMLLDAVREKTVTHPEGSPDDALNMSVAVCDKKERGKDGAWGWEPTTPDGDETPMEAISAVLWAARTTKRVPGRKQVAFA